MTSIVILSNASLNIVAKLNLFIVFESHCLYLLTTFFQCDFNGLKIETSHGCNIFGGKQYKCICLSAQNSDKSKLKLDYCDHPKIISRGMGPFFRPN